MKKAELILDIMSTIMELPVETRNALWDFLVENGYFKKNRKGDTAKCPPKTELILFQRPQLHKYM